ncbi:hypothetical protein ACSTAY_16285 [Vreelandella alkaliphila]|uniref:Lipid/polyisoprenoid-binding YceI-like domain-containing protein n=1 Tax=Vreelandella alkaliphila TaxID=272774 RepID=A0ABX4HI42_9GAMM|nr:hypothetical protein [Halomonas humidisoli]PAU72129.1 hypothetical protein CK497_10180 [Halomonas humidisoli]
MINQQRVMGCALLMGGLMLVATPVLADEISGTLDGEPKEWHVVTHSQGSTANFSEMMPGIMNVTVQGHREPRFETQGTLSISFIVMSGDAGDASVSYFPESGILPHYGTEQDVPIDIELLDVDGDTGRVKGRVATSLAYVASMSDDYDHSNTMDVDVSFDVTLVREEY